MLRVAGSGVFGRFIGLAVSVFIVALMIFRGRTIGGIPERERGGHRDV